MHDSWADEWMESVNDWKDGQGRWRHTHTNIQIKEWETQKMERKFSTCAFSISVVSLKYN